MLVGRVIDVSCSRFSSGSCPEQVTLSIDGINPVQGFSLPNKHGWVLGQQVVIVVMAIEHEQEELEQSAAA